MLKPEKQEELKKRLKKLGVQEELLVEKFILGSGRGGQKVNKTSSCVYLKDPVSGFKVKCQQTRSRELNRFHARRKLCELIEERDHQKLSEKAKEIAKLRKQKQRRKRRSAQTQKPSTKAKSQQELLRENEE